MYYEIIIKNICYYCKKNVNITKCINFECVNYMCSRKSEAFPSRTFGFAKSCPNHSKTKIIDGYKYTYCKKCVNNDCCILV